MDAQGGGDASGGGGAAQARTGTAGLTLVVVHDASLGKTGDGMLFGGASAQVREWWCEKAHHSQS